MVRRVNETLRVRHHAENAASVITQAGDMVNRTVWVDRILSELAIGINIAERNLAGPADTLQRLIVRETDLTFPVRDRQVYSLIGIDEDTSIRSGLQVDPAIFKPPRIIVGDSRLLAIAT